MSNPPKGAISDGPQYYCEYYFSAGEWWKIGQNTQPNYYCPYTVPSDPPGYEGETLTMSPLPKYPSATPESAQVTPDSGEFYCEYEFRDGKLQLTQANCPEGHFAPADPLEFAKQHGKVRIYPPRVPGATGPEDVS